ncbi:uncharacterized protein [Rutidosis leptorrhynchoides]|uniref:uncharacterized protein n=1 Tax=Rutidosis leptorrhynchoides TaxID=125765 RepID=UPI003A9A2051
MGKSGGVTTAKRKKGRPSLADLKKRAALEEEEEQQLQNEKRRSTRGNPNFAAEDQMTKKSIMMTLMMNEKRKKLKLVIRLPQLDQQSDLIRSSPVKQVSCGSDSIADVDNRKINSGSGGIVTSSQADVVYLI